MLTGSNRFFTLNFKLVCLFVLAFTFLPACNVGQQEQTAKKVETKNASSTSDVSGTKPGLPIVVAPEDPETTTTLFPCKGEQPGNVLGISEQAETPQRVAAFIKKLGEADPKVRACAARQLGYLGSESKAALPYLIKLLRDDEQHGVRINASDALWAIGPEAKDNVTERIELLKNQDVYIRLYAAFALGYYKPHISEEEAVVKALSSAVKDEDKFVRWMSLRGLQRLGPIAKAAIPIFIEILRDQDNPLRRDAAIALGRIGPEAIAAVPTLLNTLYNADDYVLYLHAAIALGRVGPVILPLLEKEIKTKHTLQVLEVLEHLGPGGAPLVIEAMRMPNKEVRKKAIDIIKLLGPAAEPAVPLLAKALKDPDKEVRDAAVNALRFLGPSAKAAVPALIAALDDKDDVMRCNAAEALGKIGPAAKPAVPKLLQLMKLPAEGEREIPQRCAAEGLMTMSPETKALVPDDMVKRVEEFDKWARSALSEHDLLEDETRPKSVKRPSRQAF